jgi:hypothetical protein
MVLLVAGIAISAISASQFAGTFLQENTIIDQALIQPGNLLEASIGITDVSRPITIAVNIEGSQVGGVEEEAANNGQQQVGEQGTTRTVVTFKDPSGAVLSNNTYSTDLRGTFQPRNTGHHLLTITNAGTRNITIDGAVGYLPFISSATPSEQNPLMPLIDYDSLSLLNGGSIVAAIGFFTIISEMVIIAIENKKKRRKDALEALAKSRIGRFIEKPKIAVNASNMSLYATFSIPDELIRQKKTIAYLESSGGSIIFFNDNEDQTGNSSRKLTFAPLRSEIKNLEEGGCETIERIVERVNQAGAFEESTKVISVRCNIELGPPSLDKESQSKCISSISYEKVVLHIQQDYADILNNDYGKVNASLQLITDMAIYPKRFKSIKYYIKNTGNEPLRFPDSAMVVEELKKVDSSDITRRAPSSVRIEELKPGFTQKLAELDIERERYPNGEYRLTVRLEKFCTDTTLELGNKP